MIRNIFLSLLFFFGPALLMLVIRNIFYLVRIWWLLRKAKHRDEVIDVTPHHESRAKPSMFFIASAIAVGLLSAWLAWQSIHSTPEEMGEHYVPAHINEQGQMVPGQRVPR